MLFRSHPHDDNADHDYWHGGFRITKLNSTVSRSSLSSVSRRGRDTPLEALGSAPEHCLNELKAQKPLLWAAGGVLIVQALALYSVLYRMTGLGTGNWERRGGGRPSWGAGFPGKAKGSID